MTNETPNPVVNGRSVVARALWIRYILFFLSGVCFGALLVLLARESQVEDKPDAEKIRGTVYGSSSYDRMKPADAILIEDGTLTAAINARYSTQVVEARVDLNSTDEIKLLIEFSYNDFRVLNVQNMSGGNQSTILSAGNYVQILNTGDNKFIIQWANLNQLPHEIVFRFFRQDIPINTRTIRINQE